MTRRSGRGFTLLEVMVALLVTSLVVLLAYATLSAATDTEARVARAHAVARHEAAARALLADALRHAVAEARRDGRTWALESDDAGSTRRFSFVTRGVQVPHGASGRWFVTLYASARDIRLSAVSLDDASPTLETSLPGVRFSVRCFDRAAGAWRDTWPDITRLPDAIDVTLSDSAGRAVGPPVVARLSPMGTL
jgi:general secretion pathway protein J